MLLDWRMRRRREKHKIFNRLMKILKINRMIRNRS